MELLQSLMFASAIVLNASVCCLICKHSGQAMKTYSRLMLASCLADLGQSVVLFIIQPVSFKLKTHRLILHKKKTNYAQCDRI